MKNAIRIFHSIHSGGFYGAEKVVFDLFKLQLERRDCEPSLLGLLDPGAKHNTLGRRLEDIAGDVHYLEGPRGVTPASLARYGRAMKDLKPHLVHSHGYKPTFYHLLSRALGFHDIPLVVTAHGYAKESGGAKAALYRRLDLRLLTRTRAVAAVSQEMHTYLSRSNPDIPVVTIENGIDTAIAVNGSHPLLSMLENDAESSPIIGSVGRLVPMKNHALLIEAVAELRRERPCRLVIIGDGPLRPELERLWRGKLPDLPMRLLPFQDDILAWMRDFDIFCLPSRDGEGLPIALLEAGLLEKAAVCSDSGGMAQFIRPGKNGLSFSMGDKQGLIRALAEALDSPEKREAMGRALKETVIANHDMRNTEAQYHSLYLAALADTRKGFEVFA